MDLRTTIRTIPDFPKPGILFRDITTLLSNPVAYRESIDRIAASVEHHGADVVVGAEARGYVVGGPLAYAMNIGLVLARKPGKLPSETISQAYGLEYGTDIMEMHRDAILPGTKVIVADDLLATGGTALAVCKLIEQLGGVVVALRFIIELPSLGGRELLKGYDVDSLVVYEGD